MHVYGFNSVIFLNDRAQYTFILYQLKTKFSFTAIKQ